LTVALKHRLRHPADPSERGLGGQQRDADDDRQDHDRQTDVGRRFQPSVDRRASQHRRDGQHGEGERRRDLEPGRRGQGGRGITPVQPGSAQQHDRRGRRRPGHDPAEGVAGQLRTRDREPAGHTERDPVEVPQADPARELEEEHERREGPVEVLEGSPRGKDRDEAGQEDLERDRRDD
jgi:hypothetical protein